MTTLADWLTRLDAEKILLVEIDAAGTPLYLADTAYYTEPGDTPSSRSYAPVIAQDGMPRLKRKIQEVWGGRSLASWGPLELATQFVAGNDLASMMLSGKTLDVLLTGPRVNVPRSEAATMLSGIIGPRSGNVDGGLTIEVHDEQSLWEDIELPSNQYDGTETAAFPAANIGISKPVALGKCRNVPAVLIDASNWTYQVHDGGIDAMQAIDAVYDNGVSVSYTPNTTAGTFVLSAAPSGVITADVQGMKEAATTYHSTHSAIIDYLARTFGGLSAPSIDISGLPTGTAGIYLNSSTTLSDVITRLMAGVIGWWGFSRAGVMTAQLFAPPVIGGTVYDETLHLSDLTWSEEDDVVWSVPLRYRRNWLKLAPASSVAIDTAVWLRSDGNTSRVKDADILSDYPTARAVDILETYFDDQADADAVGTRALALFGTQRRRSKVTVPLSDPLPALGDEITLADADVLNGNHVVIGLTDTLDGEIPMIDMEMWG